jgi:hypothetical protein
VDWRARGRWRMLLVADRRRGGTPFMLRARAALAAVCVAAVAVGCADRTAPDGPDSTVAGPAPTTATPAATSTPTTTIPPAAQAGWPTTPRERPWPQHGEGGQLVAVRTGQHPGFERVVFEFRGGPIGYHIRYVPEVTWGESDKVVRLPGRAFLQVSFLGARAHRLDDPNVRTYDGPEPLTPRYPVMQQVTLASDWEGELRFGIGLARKAGFRVLRLSDPTRVAVDFAA